MVKKVINWLRKKVEPYLGEGLIQSIDYFTKSGKMDTAQSLQNGVLKYAPKVADLAIQYATDRLQGRDKRMPTYYAPAIIDASKQTTNPTFDVAYTPRDYPVFRDSRSAIPQIVQAVPVPRYYEPDVDNLYKSKQKKKPATDKKKKKKKVSTASMSDVKKKKMKSDKKAKKPTKASVTDGKKKKKTSK
jgi:hypothetical protein